MMAVLLVLGSSSAKTQTIDFETLPGGGATVDQQTISNEYISYGVTFTLLDHTTGLPIGSPRIAKAGAPLTAFEGCFADDTPYAYLGLGSSFLTDGTGLGIEGDLLIEYTTPVAQASGLILDIDCRTNGGPPCEQWTITAFDSLGAVLDSVVLDAPIGSPNPACASPGAGPGDSEAFAWAFDVGSPLIKEVLLRYTGVAGGPGLAFDNFSVSSLPADLAVVTTASADSVCRGETVELMAFPSGGFPPYTFQWQLKTGPSSWIDLGTGDTESVIAAAEATYRVIVADTDSNEVTGAEVTIEVVTGGTLCEADLLVASYNNNRVVRYSFLTWQGEVFVPSGSGGLNGASDIDCGPDGNLYVSSQANDRILRYDGSTGAFIDIFVPAGSGGLNIPVGLDFGPDGNLYVVSNANHSVLRYDGSTGAFMDVFVPTGSGLNSPSGLTFGPDGILYVCSFLSDKVLYFDGTTGAALGDFVTTGSGGLDAPRGLTFGPDGNLYIAEDLNDSVRRYDGTTGAFIDVFVGSGSGGLDRANDVFFGPDGDLYVVGYISNYVYGYDGTTGAFLGTLPNDLLNGPAWFAMSCGPRATAVRDRKDLPGPELTIEPNVPNPFNPRTQIAFTLPEGGRARVRVVDISGRIVATLVDRALPEGRHVVVWDGDTSSGHSAPSGVYFVSVECNGRRATGKVALIR